MPQFTMHEAKTHFSRLIRLMEAGEEVVIARGDRPVAKLCPYREEKAERHLGSAAGKITIAPDFDAPLEEFRDYQ